MNDMPEELRLFRSQLRDAIERDLGRRSPRSRVAQRRSLRLGLPTLAVRRRRDRRRRARPDAHRGFGAERLCGGEEGARGDGGGQLRDDHRCGQPRRLLLHPRHDAVERRLDRGDARGQERVRPQPGARPDRRRRLRGAGRTGPGCTTRANPASGQRSARMVELAHDNVAGNAADQILVARDRAHCRASQPDGTTVYTGTIPNPQHGSRRRTDRRHDPARHRRPANRQRRYAALTRRLRLPASTTVSSCR